jgi:hypothetical protein
MIVSGRYRPVTPLGRRYVSFTRTVKASASLELPGTMASPGYPRFPRTRLGRAAGRILIATIVGQDDGSSIPLSEVDPR